MHCALIRCLVTIAVHLSLFCMLPINESQKAEDPKFLHKISRSIFPLFGHFYVFGRKKNLNITVPSNSQMTVIILVHEEGQVK